MKAETTKNLVHYYFNAIKILLKYYLDYYKNTIDMLLPEYRFHVT